MLLVNCTLNKYEIVIRWRIYVKETIEKNMFLSSKVEQFPRRKKCNECKRYELTDNIVYLERYINDL